MTVIGAVLLVLAVFGFVSTLLVANQARAISAAETLPVNQLEALRQTSDRAGGRGRFSKPCEVVGAAYPNPQGPLISGLGKTECVWFRYQVVRHYEVTSGGPQGNRTTRSSQTLIDYTSPQGYALRDDQGGLIGVDPGGLPAHQPEKSVGHFEPSQPQQKPYLFGVQLPDLPHEKGTTTGYEYLEWVLRPGQRLYVLGEVHDRNGPLVIGKSDNAHSVVSTLSKTELRRNRGRTAWVIGIGSLVAAALGLAVLVAG